jgi:16S rRNA (guanine(966)-N(2))-methyltransferase RsmD
MMRSKHQTGIKCFEAAILGGKHKGKKILIPDVSTTRSSKSILRESLFNTLQFDIIGKNFIEVFAGSGSVGLEALSRGADRAYFIERNYNVLKVLKSNISMISPAKSTLIYGDSFEEFPALLHALNSDNKRNYFYFDPPFSIRQGMGDVYDKTLDLISVIDTSICEKVIIEHISKLELPSKIGNFRLQKKKKFGKSTLSYYG